MPRSRSIIFLFILLIGACADPDRGGITEPIVDPRQLTVDEQLIVNANQVFGFNLLRQVSEAQPTDNLMISPLSISLALGMTLNGAASSTFTEMRDALGFGAIDRTQVNAAYEGLLGQLRARDDDVEFTIANSVWHASDFAVESTFLADAENYFDAEVRQLDFRSASAPGTINKWVSDRTGGRIRDLVDAVKPDDVMFLINAMYYKAAWSSPFLAQSTRDAPFRRTDGTTVTARLMTRDGSYPSYRDDRLEAVELFYEDSAYSMVVVAPATGSVDALVRTFGAAEWQQLVERLTPGRIMLSLPRFEYRFGADLNDALKALGMERAFQPHGADFSRINPRRTDLHISRVAHKTFISVDEEGTEASAATSVTMSVTSMPPSFQFDRPFLFAIRERSTNTVLFLGVVRDPSQR